MPANYVNVNLDANDLIPEFPLGTLGSNDGGKIVFEYIKFNDGDGPVTAVAGHLVCGLDSGYPDGEVCNDYNSSSIKILLTDPRGFLQRVLTDGYYGWAQCWGRNKQVIITDQSVAQDEELMVHATTDGAVDSHDDTAAKVVGIALETDGDTIAAQLDVGQVKITIRC